MPKARTAKLDHAALHIQRSKKAPTLLEESRPRLAAARAPSCPLLPWATPQNYTLALWQKLNALPEYP